MRVVVKKIGLDSYVDEFDAPDGMHVHELKQYICVCHISMFYPYL